ncbi:MAG: hypothetical protein HXS41_11040 [Theionarchaea archaeon]|nr:hypothetical protein [Theionarchaea archaeon]MBU7000538.1 hypothetical protein [Theionarchaea archaeon]MBU7021581.1 hypothetical protein [Theionarchaea archaeon]MBU7034112.1 hypothetical protein [Theionarchaea archaeon]MBU7039951.1 hypothetical protein [Theionarchaea archaeon]
MKSVKTVLVLTVLLGLSLPAAFGGDTLSVDYHFTLVPASGCGDYMIEGSFTQAIPGEPLVPYYPATILLPEGTTVKDVKVKTSAPIVQTGMNLSWGQPPCTFSDEPVTVGKNEEIYSSDNEYPNTLFEVVSLSSFRGFQILNVNLYPIQYKPRSGTIKYYETMTVEVQFGKEMKNKLYRGLSGDKGAVAAFVDNPETVTTYSDGPEPMQTEEYIIITDDTMQSTFQELAAWKANWINGAGVYTVSWITSTYSGTDDAEKIRNFIIDWYTNHGTKYVLLGGDVSAVPYRGFYIYSGGYVDYDMLADMYFGHLDGTWNNDGDSYWAEPGEEDWYAEVGVGRAPCQTVTEAQNFVTKVIAYEKAEKPKRVLLHQSRVLSGNSPDSRCLAYNCDDWVPGDYTIDYLFEEDATVTKAAWISHWAQNPAAVAHIGHGNTSVYYINYEIGGTISWYNSDIPSMTNTFWPWTTSVACITGQIESNDCLAEAYVMDPDNGAIVAIYNDNYGWFNTGNACMYSGEFCEMEFRACYNDLEEKFGDMLNQSRNYMVSSASSNSTYRWCFYERNIVGDPESPSLTVRIDGDSVTITNPHDGDTVEGVVPITTSTQGCIDTVEFYIGGTLTYTDTVAPFEYSWDTNLYEDATYSLEVKGYCSGEYTDNHIINVTVDNSVPASLTITYPQIGQTLSGVVTVTTDAAGVDEVRFYVSDSYAYTDYTAPFTWDWDTTLYKNKGGYSLTAEGYKGGEFQVSDEVSRLKISNPSIALLSFLVLFLPIGIYWRK